MYDRTADEMRGLVEQERGRAGIELPRLGTGLRLAELVGLNVGDIR